MKRLRHPIRAAREPFGTAGLIVAMIALVAALGGSALAANGALSGKQRKEVEKIAKKFAGKPGANGAAGPAGAAGKDGSNGANGTAGTAGTPGSPGQNGTTGFTKTLPKEATETGTWAVSNEGEEDHTLASISFSIPLAQGLEETHVFWDKISAEGGTAAEEEFEEECPGSAEVPGAKKGNLCVYTGRQVGLEPIGIDKPFSPALNESGAGFNGAILQLNASVGIAYGSWAVTAP